MTSTDIFPSVETEEDIFFKKKAGWVFFVSSAVLVFQTWLAGQSDLSRRQLLLDRCIKLCWMFRKEKKAWEAIYSLRHRHSVQLGFYLVRLWKGKTQAEARTHTYRTQWILNVTNPLTPKVWFTHFLLLFLWSECKAWQLIATEK